MFSKFHHSIHHHHHHQKTGCTPSCSSGSAACQGGHQGATSPGGSGGGGCDSMHNSAQCLANNALILEGNPLSHHFEIGRYIGTAGPENAWRIFEGLRKQDGKEVSLFIFEKRLAEKLHKPKRKEAITEILKSSCKSLERFRHPKILQVVCGAEESPETLCFASEPVINSLSNILAQDNENAHFLDIELKYGILQLTEALQFLHYTGRVLHRNVCPSSILITKRGTWKLAGLEFIEKASEVDGLEPIQCQPWTSRLPKMGQPDLDYTAPEIQQGQCSILSDMFSLGMVISAIFNVGGKPLIQSNHSATHHQKQVENLESCVNILLPRVPIGLQEALIRLLSKEQRQRPTSQLLALIKYFSDQTVHALQFLDVISMKDPSQKSHFYRNNLKEVLPYVPRKLIWQHVWPGLQTEMKTQEVLAAVLQPILFLIQESTTSEYESLILPTFRQVFNTPKTIQAIVTLLENLHIILDKSAGMDNFNIFLKEEILPMLFSSFDSSTIQVQNAALIATSLVASYLDTESIRKIIMPKTKIVYEKYSTDLKVVLNVLTCIEQILDKIERSMIIEDVLPILYDAKLQDPDINYKVVQIYRQMLTDKKYGLSVNLMATRVMPSLLPQTINPGLNLEQFSSLLEVLQEMLDCIERNQRNKLKLDHLSLSPERNMIFGRQLRHQRSTDNMQHIHVRMDRKTSSAEDMMINQRKGSSGSGNSPISGSTLSISGTGEMSRAEQSANNFLRVSQQQYTIRRLSDNTMMPPKIKIASCGSTGSSNLLAAGDSNNLPIRRHSSIGPPEGARRSSGYNLSPPHLSKNGGSVPNSISISTQASKIGLGSSISTTSLMNSVAATAHSSSNMSLLSTSVSNLKSRRASALPNNTSGLFQNIQSGVYQFFGGDTRSGGK